MGRLLRCGPYLILGLGLALVLIFGRQEVLSPFGQSAAEDGTQEVWGSTTVGQTFVAPFDGLLQIDVRLGTGGRANTQDLLLHLRAAPDATEDLRSAVVNAATLTRDDWASFKFVPIPNSGGRSFYFFLESPSSTPRDALSVFRSQGDRYRDGSYFLNGAPAEGALTFRVYSRPSLLGWLRGLSRLLAHGKPSVWGDPACYGVLLVGYLILLAVVVHRLVRFGPEEGTD